MASAKKQEQKELCEQDVVALSALSSALMFSAVVPVTVTFVRRFRKTRDAENGGLRRCYTRLTFGFRDVRSSANGVADATIKLVRLLLTDTSVLCSYYYAWVPESVTITVRKGGMLVPRRSGHLDTGFNGGSYSWLAFVRHAPGC